MILDIYWHMRWVLQGLSITHLDFSWDLDGEYPPRNHGGWGTRNLTGADCSATRWSQSWGFGSPEAMNSWPVRLVDPLGPLGPRGYLRRCLVAPAIQAPQTTSKAVSERNNMVVVHIKSPKNTLKHLKTIPSTLKTQNQPTNSLKPTPKPSFSNMFVPFRGFPPRGLHRRGFAGDDHHCLLRRRSDDHDDRPILPLKMMDITWLTGWCFGTWILFFPYIYIGNNDPNWLSYFSEGLKPTS